MTAGEWPLRSRNAQRQAATSELVLPPLTLQWSKTFPFADLNDQSPTYVAARGILFVVSRGADQTKSLLALDPSSGAEIWSKGFFNGYHFEELGYDETTARLYASTPFYVTCH